MEIISFIYVFSLFVVFIPGMFFKIKGTNYWMEILINAVLFTITLSLSYKLIDSKLYEGVEMSDSPDIGDGICTDCNGFEDSDDDDHIHNVLTTSIVINTKPNSEHEINTNGSSVDKELAYAPYDNSESTDSIVDIEPSDVDTSNNYILTYYALARNQDRTANNTLITKVDGKSVDTFTPTKYQENRNQWNKRVVNFINDKSNVELNISAIMMSINTNKDTSTAITNISLTKDGKDVFPAQKFNAKQIPVNSYGNVKFGDAAPGWNNTGNVTVMNVSNAWGYQKPYPGEGYALNMRWGASIYTTI
jgi:hypothetical protein